MSCSCNSTARYSAYPVAPARAQTDAFTAALTLLMVKTVYRRLETAAENVRNSNNNNNNKIASISGDNREPSFLFQRISITIQCFNLILLHNSFSSDEE